MPEGRPLHRDGLITCVVLVHDDRGRIDHRRPLEYLQDRDVARLGDAWVIVAEHERELLDWDVEVDDERARVVGGGTEP